MSPSHLVSLWMGYVPGKVFPTRNRRCLLYKNVTVLVISTSPFLYGAFSCTQEKNKIASGSATRKRNLMIMWNWCSTKIWNVLMPKKYRQCFLTCSAKQVRIFQHWCTVGELLLSSMYKMLGKNDSTECFEYDGPLEAFNVSTSINILSIFGQKSCAQIKNLTI